MYALDGRFIDVTDDIICFFSYLFVVVLDLSKDSH